MHNKRLVVSSTESGQRVISEIDVKDCAPVYMRVLYQDSSVIDDDYDVDLSESKESEAASHSTAIEDIKQDTLLGSIMFTPNGNTVPLAQQFSFIAGKSSKSADVNKTVKEAGYSGYTLADILDNSDLAKPLRVSAKKMFPNINPQTGKPDIDEDDSITSYISLASFSGAILPQYDSDGNIYFNQDGIVTIGEFLDSLLAMKIGREHESSAKKSLDGMSDVGDFYNEGYNLCLRTLSSPFYRLYSRKDMLTPLTRIELAYILVVCWEEFMQKFDNVYGGKYTVGINLNWDTPQRYVGKFSDGRFYKVYKKCHNTEMGKITAIDLAYYKGEGVVGMSSFKQLMLSGQKPIPLPMFMSLFEIDALGLFLFEDNLLNPFKEVSRKELAYCLVKIGQIFSEPYIG